MTEDLDLFPGEQLDFGTPLGVPTEPMSPDAINEKYARGDARIVTEQARYPLNTIVSMLDSGKYNINPEYQRRRRWSRLKQSRLMESFLMNVPIPPVFLYEAQFSQYEVMDGLQRITAITEFYRDGYKLEGLLEWPELNGYSYKTLPEQVRRGIDRRYLSSIVLLQETAKEEQEAQRLKQLVFERINSGGDKLEAQESRNALYPGPLNQMCIELARTPSFCRLWQIPLDTVTLQQLNLLEEVEEGEEGDRAAGEPEQDGVLERNDLYRKMQDVELVLRFFAYRQLERIDQGRLRDFLDEFLKKANSFSAELLRHYRELFVSTSDLVYDVLGERALFLFRRRKPDSWSWYERPTKVLYDPIMFAFSRCLGAEKRLRERAQDIKRALEPFYQKSYSTFEGRSTNHQDILNRRKMMLAFLAPFGR